MLKPYKRKIKKFKNIGFDIETYGDSNKFLLSSFYFSDDEIYTFDDKDENIDFILKNSKKFKDSIIWAHNMAFDFLGLLYGTDHFKEFFILQRGSDFILASSNVYKNKFCYAIPTKTRDLRQIDKITFYDTMSHAKFSLKSIGDIIGIPKLEKPDFLGSKPKTRSEYAYLKKYNIQDSKITKYFADFLQKSYNSLGCQIKSTIASTSMDLFRRKYLKRSLWTPDKEILKILYKAYYGGRTEILNRGYNTEPLNVYDFNSQYPYVMKTKEYPDPNTMRKFNTGALDTLKNYMGITNVTLEAPDIHLPYIPYRDDKLLFPKGIIKGYYTNYEIMKALEYGYKIKNIKDGIYYTKTFNLFDEFVTTLYDLRLKYKADNNPMQMPTKILLNSLYGKWAQNIFDKSEIIHINNITQDQYNDPKTQYITDEFFRISKEYDKIPNFINPIISIYVTAYARSLLYDNILNIDSENVFYMDTDSIFTTKNINSSLKLGALKHEYTAKDYYLVKPKFYALRLTDDSVKIRIKGCHNLIQNMESFEDILKNKNTRSFRFMKYREALRSGLDPNTKINADKILNLEDTKRLWKNKFNLKNFEGSHALVI